MCVTKRPAHLFSPEIGREGPIPINLLSRATLMRPVIAVDSGVLHQTC
jgi:hypothetical protein